MDLLIKRCCLLLATLRRMAKGQDPTVSARRMTLVASLVGTWDQPSFNPLAKGGC